VIGYARVSTPDQALGDSVEAQVAIGVAADASRPVPDG
jgi:DNA invertase Pin-like site-specific DNA recombinase